MASGQNQGGFRLPSIPARAYQNTVQQAPTSTTTEGGFPRWGQCVICNNNNNSGCNYEEIDFYPLPCLHLICSDGCLGRLKEYVDPLACPRCKVKFQEDNVLCKAFRPLGILDKVDEQSEPPVVVVVCTYCFRGDEGVSWCLNCEEFLCQNCTDHHPHAKATHNHILSTDLRNRKKADSLSAEEEQALLKGCQVHRGEDLTTFCETCEVKLCNLCIASYPVHAEHRLSGIPQLVAEFRQDLEKSMKSVFVIARIVKQAEADLKEKVEHVLKTEKEYLLNEAAAQFSILLSTLMNREMAMRKEITEMTVTKAKLLNIKRAKLKSILLQSYQYNRMVKDISTKGSDETILRMRSLLKAQLEKLKMNSNIVTDKSNYVSYCEQGHHFMMEKQVCNSAERHLAAIGKCTYAYNPNSRVHQKMYKNVECIKRSASIAQAQAAASAAIAAANKNIPNPMARIGGRPGPNIRIIPNAAIRASSSTHQSQPAETVTNSRSVANGQAERPQMARRSVAMKRTGGLQRSPIAYVRSSPITSPEIRVVPIPMATPDRSSDAENSDTENDRACIMEEVVEDEELQNGYGSDGDVDSTTLIIDESRKREDEEDDDDQVEVNEMFVDAEMPFGTDDTEQMDVDNSDEEVLRKEQLNETTNQENTVIVIEERQTVEESKVEKAAVLNQQEEEDVVSNPVDNQDHEEEAVSIPVVSKNEEEAVSNPVGSQEEEAVSIPVVSKNEEEAVSNSVDIQEEEMETTVLAASFNEEDDDEGPPHLTPQSESIPQGRRISRKAHLELRKDDEMQLEEVPNVLQTTESQKTKPPPELEANSPVKSRKETLPGIRARVAKTAAQIAPAIKKLSETPPVVLAKKSKPVVLTSPGRNVALPMISPASDTDGTRVGKRERKKTVMSPEFIDPEEIQITRRATTPRREPSPNKPSTSRGTSGVGPDFGPAGYESSSSNYSNETRNKKPKKRASTGYLSRRSNKKRKAAGRKSTSSVPGSSTGGRNSPVADLLSSLDRDPDDMMKFTNTDDNEDYCAVCRDGGEDIMICCDNCPKVFHLKCHMPAVDDVPPDDWQCNWCKDKVEACKVPPINLNMPTPNVIGSTRFTRGLMQKPEEFQTACKFLSEVFKVPESVSLRTGLDVLVKEHTIDSGLHLHTIRQRLTNGRPSPFKDVLEFIITLRMMIHAATTKLAHKIKPDQKFLETFETKFNDLVTGYFPTMVAITHESPQSSAPGPSTSAALV